MKKIVLVKPVFQINRKTGTDIAQKKVSEIQELKKPGFP
jgi:hypothetical protein